MKSTRICVFPDTLPQDDIFFPLVQVFDQVVYLRPVENDRPDEEKASPLLREAMTENLIDFCCPAPLEDDRERFLRLVNDLQNRPDDYAGQLANLSLAGLGRRGEQESKTTIINTLLKQNGIKEKNQEQRETVLWQARLVLALGEIFDRDQAAIQKNLAQLAAKQQGLLDELREDDQQPFSFTKKIMGSNTQTEKQLRLRLKAWSRLFALGSKEVNISIFVTTNSDILDLLVEHYDVYEQKNPTKLLEILLPMACFTDLSLKQHVDSIKHNKAQISLESDILKKLASASQQERDRYMREWTEILQHTFSPKKYKYCKISLYAFHDTSPQKIFLETFGRDEDEFKLSPSPSLHGTSDTIVGILS
jgi:hypothetical protein